LATVSHSYGFDAERQFCHERRAGVSVGYVRHVVVLSSSPRATNGD